MPVTCGKIKIQETESRRCPSAHIVSATMASLPINSGAISTDLFILPRARKYLSTRRALISVPASPLSARLGTVARVGPRAVFPRVLYTRGGQNGRSRVVGLDDRGAQDRRALRASSALRSSAGIGLPPTGAITRQRVTAKAAYRQPSLLRKPCYESRPCYESLGRNMRPTDRAATAYCWSRWPR